MNNINAAVNAIYKAIDEKKGEDIKVINISKISVLADYFIIATSTNSSQMGAIVDNISDKLLENKIHPLRIEGDEKSNWVLMDYGDVVIHIFDIESRKFYDLDRIWSDGELEIIE